MGSSRVTYDVDLCYRRTPDNLERLATALGTLSLTLRGAPPSRKACAEAKAEAPRRSDAPHASHVTASPAPAPAVRVAGAASPDGAPARHRSRTSPATAALRPALRAPRHVRRAHPGPATLSLRRTAPRSARGEPPAGVRCDGPWRRRGR